MKIIYEIHVKNLYNNISKEFKRKLSLEDMFNFNSIDPTSDLRRKEVAGKYLDWIVKDYFNRVCPKSSIEDYPSSIFARDVYSLLNKYTTFKNRGYVTYSDIFKYSFESLEKEISYIEKTYGEIIFNKASKGKDYDILVDDSKYTIYNVKTPEGSMFLGKYTKWCISKEDSFILDIRDYIRSNYSVIFILSKREKNTAKDKDSNIMFPNSKELYGIILTPEKEYDEIVNANNNSLFYTNKFEEINRVLLQYKII